MNVNDVYRVIFACWMQGQLGLNVRYYWVRTRIGIFDDAALAQDLYVTFGPLYAALLSSQAEVLGVSVRNLTVLPMRAAAVSDPPFTPGLVIGDPLPSQVAGIITLRSVFAGRSNRGRVYIPFPAESQSGAGGRPTAPYVTNAQLLADELASTQTVGTPGDGATLDPIIKDDAIANRTIISSAIARPVWATQRRRGAYGAPNPEAVPL